MLPAVYMSNQVPGELFVIGFHSNGITGLEASKQVTDRAAIRKHHVVYHRERRNQFRPRRGRQDRRDWSVHDHDQGAGARSRSGQATAVFREHRVKAAGNDANGYAAVSQLPYD